MAAFRKVVIGLGLMSLASVSVQVSADPFAELEAATRGQASGNAGMATDFEEYRQAHLQAFESYKETVRREYEEFLDLYKEVSSAYLERIAEVWSSPEESSRTRWVQYDDDYQERRVVDFERRMITISSPTGERELSEEKARAAAEELLEMTRKDAFEKDEVATAVEKESRERFKSLEVATLDEQPVLMSFLLGEKASEPEEQERIKKAVLSAPDRKAGTEKGQKIVSWSFPMEASAESWNSGIVEPQDLESEPQFASAMSPRSIAPGQIERLPARARPFVDAINRENQAFELSTPLLLAIMETESAFNPMARSPIPAFGLMQIVPSSAGQDATEKLFGEARLLAPSFLYNPENNIQVGAAYFNILFYRYFKGIEDPVVRLYCAIAAYNTGPGNVSRALTGSSMALRPAIRIANTMSPEQVYQHLLANLPYEETVNYLRKVTARMAKFEEVVSGG